MLKLCDSISLPNEALSQLLALPEVAKAARGELGFQTVTGEPYAFMMDDSKPERQKVSLSLTNVTVREALNAIARAHGTAVWILVRQMIVVQTMDASSSIYISLAGYSFTELFAVADRRLKLRIKRGLKPEEKRR